jgi:hypothetical protein
MDDKTIFTKTAKGLSEASGKTRALPHELRDILKEIDGTSSVDELTDAIGVPGAKLREALTRLTAEDYIHEFVPPSVAEEDDFDLGLPSLQGTSDPMMRVTNDKARREAEEKARREAEEELRAAGERKRRAEEEREKKEAEKRARQEAKARAKQEAKERAQRKAEDKTGIGSEPEAEALAGQEHMRTRTRIAGRRPAETVEKPAGRHKSDRTGRVEQSRTPVISIKDRKPFNMRFELPDWPFRSPFRKPIKWQKPVAVAATIVLATGAFVALTTSYDGKAAQFASLATAQIGQPVTVGKVRLSLLPQPHWRLEDVSVGKQGQIRVAQVDAMTGFSSLFSDMTVYRSVVLVSPIVNEEGLGWLMFGSSASPSDKFRFEQISATGARLASDAIEFPTFRVEAAFDPYGSWRTISVDADDKTLHLDLKPQRDAVHIDMLAEGFVLPFGSTVKFDSLHASGSATRTALSFPKFSGKLLGGFIDGSAALKWGDGWKLEGNTKLTQIDTPPLAPRLLEGGKLDGIASYAMDAPTASALFSHAAMNGNVTIHNGAVLGVNLAGVLRGISAGGKSPFTLLETEFSLDQGKTQIRNLHADSGAVSTSGNADIDASGKINGRFAVDLQTSTRQTRAFVGLGGTVDMPKFHR